MPDEGRYVVAGSSYNGSGRGGAVAIQPDGKIVVVGWTQISDQQTTLVLAATNRAGRWTPASTQATVPSPPLAAMTRRPKGAWWVRAETSIVGKERKTDRGAWNQ